MSLLRQIRTSLRRRLEQVTEIAELSRYPAVQLFLARLRRVRRQRLTPREAPALGTLVRRLGGLPYAEIANILGGSAEAARRAAADGIAALRKTYLEGEA